MKLIHRLIAWLTGKNLPSAPRALILDQMAEMRPLPLGMKELDEWTDRIISGALLPADHDSQKVALCEMIVHMKPTEDHCNDGFFIKSLRKAAANQVAFAKMDMIRNTRKAALAKEEDAATIEEPTEIAPDMKPLAVGRFAAHQKD